MAAAHTQTPQVFVPVSYCLLKPAEHNRPQLWLAINASVLTPTSALHQAGTDCSSQHREGIQEQRRGASFPKPCCLHAKEKQGYSPQLETRYYHLSLSKATEHPHLGFGKKARLCHSQLVTRRERPVAPPTPPHSPQFLQHLVSSEKGHRPSTCATLLLWQGVKLRRLAPAMKQEARKNHKSETV